LLKEGRIVEGRKGRKAEGQKGRRAEGQKGRKVEGQNSRRAADFNFIMSLSFFLSRILFCEYIFLSLYLVYSFSVYLPLSHSVSVSNYL